MLNGPSTTLRRGPVLGLERRMAGDPRLGFIDDFVRISYLTSSGMGVRPGLADRGRMDAVSNLFLCSSLDNRYLIAGDSLVTGNQR